MHCPGLYNGGKICRLPVLPGFAAQLLCKRRDDGTPGRLVAVAVADDAGTPGPAEELRSEPRRKLIILNLQ
jgi:hypothetical protein